MNRNFIKIMAVSFIAFATSLILSAEGNLMVSSIPMQADILLNGKKQAFKTPALFRDMKAGTYQVVIRKSGFQDYHATVVVKNDETAMLDKSFESDIFRLSFPDESSISVGDQLLDYDGGILTVPQAQFDFKRYDDILYLIPIYPAQKLVTILDVALPVSTLVTVTAWSSDFNFKEVSNTHNERDFLVDPFTIGVSATTIGLGIWQYWLSLDRAKYLKEYSLKTRQLNNTSGKDWEYFKKAQDLLALNKRDEAIKFFELVITEYPDSANTPEAYYRLGRLYRLEGDIESARKHFQVIVDKFPVPALYDRSCKILADLTENPGQKLAYLKMMVFVDDLYDRAGIEEEIAELEASN